MMRCPACLLLLLLSLPVARAAEQPVLDALDQLSPRLLLGVNRAGGQVLTGALAWPDSLEPAIAWREALCPGPGRADGGSPDDVDARLGLQVLVLDGGRRALNQYGRELAWQGRQELPASLDELPRPELLAVSAGRALLVADPRGGVALKRPGEDWRPLLDYARAGLLRPRALEAVGERVFLMDGDGAGRRLLLCGTDGAWRRAWPAPGLLALHRGGEGDLLLLWRRGEGLELERWPLAARLEELPGESFAVARFAAPADLERHPPRDFLWLPAPAGGPGRLLLARRGAPALLLAPGAP